MRAGQRRRRSPGLQAVAASLVLLVAACATDSDSGTDLPPAPGAATADRLDPEDLA